MSRIHDVWHQAFQGLLVARAGETAHAWRMGLTRAKGWGLDYIATMGETPPQPLAAYDYVALSSVNAIDDAMALTAALEIANPQAPLILVPTNPGLIAGLDQNDLFADNVVAPEAVKDLEGVIRLSIARKAIDLAMSDQINFDAVTGFGHARDLDRVLRWSIDLGRLPGGFIALIDMALSWRDEEGQSTMGGPNHIAAFARRLSKVRRRSDFVCQPDADHVLLVLSRVHTSRDIQIAIDRIVESLLDPFLDLGPSPLSARLEIGLAHAPIEVADVPALMAQAAAARRRSALALAQNEADQA